MFWFLVEVLYEECFDLIVVDWCFFLLDVGILVVFDWKSKYFKIDFLNFYFDIYVGRD